MIESLVSSINVFGYTSTDKKDEVQITDVNKKGKKKLNFNSKASVAVIITITASFGTNNSFNDATLSSEIEKKYVNYPIVQFESDNLKYKNVLRNDIINMNNNTLEVEDLADMVTQTQIDEIKAHFDTKIQSTEAILRQDIKSTSSELEQNLKEFIREENKEIKRNKTGSFRFWVGSVLSPIITAAFVLYITKVLHLF